MPELLDLCDGCHAPSDECACEDIEAEREEEYGPRCHVCGDDGEEDYIRCMYPQTVYAAGACPHLTGTF